MFKVKVERMQLTTKIKIEPNKSQEEVLLALSEKCRLIYNFALQERKNAFKADVKITYQDQQNDLPKIKEKYPEYKVVYSKVLQGVLKKLDADYKSFFALRKKGHKDAEPPRFKGKKHFTTMVYNQSGYKVFDNKIKLSHKYNKTDLVFTIPSKFSFNNIKQIDVSQDDRGIYFLSIIDEIPTPEYKSNKLFQAFDLGTSKHTCINMYGKVKQFVNARPDRYWEKKIARCQSQRDHCKKKSKHYNKLNNRLRFMKRKSSHQLIDVQHKLSHKIVNNTKANTIILGEISVKQMMQVDKYKKTNHKSLSTGYLSRFIRFATYKAEKIGKRIKQISEVNTTKECNYCGNLQEMPLSERVYNCENCGIVIDRDVNSSINIMKRYLSQNALWTSYQHFVDIVGHTVNHKTKVPLIKGL